MEPWLFKPTRFPFEEVKANLSEWRSALLSEYESLTVLTKAIELVDDTTGSTVCTWEIGRNDQGP